MKRRSAAESDHREPGEVAASLHRMDPSGVCHVLVNHLGDTDRGGAGVKSQRITHGSGDGLARQLGLEVNIGRPEGIGVQAPERKIGVGDGGIGSAAIISSRSRFAAGAVGADTNLTKGVNPSD